MNSITDKVLKNTYWNISGKIIAFSLGLILTFYIVKKIGLENYGIYSLIIATGGYIGILDLGISTSFVKYISEFYTLKDKDRINTLMNTGFLFYLILGIFIVFLVFFLGDFIISFLNIPTNFKEEAFKVFILYSLILAFSGVFSPFTAVLMGIQRMDISNKILSLTAILNALGTVLFLELGMGLYGLVLNNLIILIISSLINIYISFNMLPGLVFNPFLFSKDMFLKIFGYGYKLQVTKLSSIFSSHLEKLILSRLLSLNYVAFYQLGNSLVEQIKNVPLLLTGALFPAFSEMGASNRIKDIKEGYIRGTKYLAFITVPILAFVSAFAYAFFMLWFGHGYDNAAYIAAMISWGYMINTIFGGVGAALVQGIGRTDIQMKGAILNLALNISLSYIFIYKFGFKGAALGTAFSLSFAVLYFTFLLNKFLDIPILKLFKIAFIKFFLAGFIAFLFVFLIVYGRDFSSRFDAIKYLISGAFLYLAIYLFIVYWLKAFDNEDIDFFYKVKNSFLNFVKLKRDEKNN
jgi:O-antigen/teichoic acid export membrane protein